MTTCMWDDCDEEGVLEVVGDFQGIEIRGEVCKEHHDALSAGTMSSVSIDEAEVRETAEALADAFGEAQDRALRELDRVIAEAPAKIDRALAGLQPPKLNRAARRARGQRTRKPNPYKRGRKR